MNYKKRYISLIIELLDLIERHMKEFDGIEESSSGSDRNSKQIMDNSSELDEPVIYKSGIKKSAIRLR